MGIKHHGRAEAVAETLLANHNNYNHSNHFDDLVADPKTKVDVNSRCRLHAAGAYQQIKQLTNHDRPAVVVQSVEGGWGWLVLIGSFLVNCIVDGYLYSFGSLFLLEVLQQFGESPFTTQLVMSLPAAIYLISGPIAAVLIYRFGCRVTAMAGSVLAATAIFVSSYSTNIIMLILTHGIFAGIGLGMMMLPSIVIISHYFNKRRPLATGFALAGSGVGPFIFHRLIGRFLAGYGWDGVNQILAGIVLNGCVCGALYRPIDNRRANRERKRSRDYRPTCDSSGLPTDDRDVSLTSQVCGGGCSDVSSETSSIPYVRGHIMQRILAQKRKQQGLSVGSLDGMIITQDNRLVRPSDKLYLPSMDNELILPKNLLDSACRSNVAVVTHCDVVNNNYDACDNNLCTFCHIQRVGSDSNVCQKPTTDDNGIIFQFAPVQEESGVLHSRAASLTLTLLRSGGSSPTLISRHSSGTSPVWKRFPSIELTNASDAVATNVQSFRFSRTVVSNNAAQNLKDSRAIPVYAAAIQNNSSVAVSLPEPETHISADNIYLNSSWSSALPASDAIRTSANIYAVPVTSVIELSSTGDRLQCVQTECDLTVDQQLAVTSKANHDHSDSTIVDVPVSTACGRDHDEDVISLPSLTLASGAPGAGCLTTSPMQLSPVLETTSRPPHVVEPVTTKPSLVNTLKPLKSSIVLYFICIGSVLPFLAVFSPVVFLPTYAHEEGSHMQVGKEEEEAQQLLDVFAVSGILGRLLVGIIASQPGVDTLILHNVSLIGAGLLTCAIPLLHAYELLCAYAAVFGICVASFLTLKSILLIEMLGIDQLPISFGLLCAFQGLASLFGSSLAAFIFDTFETFTSLFVIAGSMMLIGASLYLPLRCISRWDKRHRLRIVQATNDIDDKVDRASQRQRYVV